jgi:hypothetical protein
MMSNKKRTPSVLLVTFFYAYEVSCRARAEEAGPMSNLDDSPLIWVPR